MRWLKRKLRNWLNTDMELSLTENYPTAAPQHNMGEIQTSVQMFRAMNGMVLVLHTQHALQVKNTIGLGRQTGPTIYVLKDGESVQDAVATLLVKARLDSM